MRRFAAIVSLCLLSAPALASTITYTYGEQDGFGFGWEPGHLVTNGAELEALTLGPGDGDGTDVWKDGAKGAWYSFPVVYDLPTDEPYVSSLSVTMTWTGLNPIADLYFDGILLTGHTGNTWTPEGHWVVSQTWTVNNPNQSGFDGSSSLWITEGYPTHWALDYFTVTLETSAAPPPAEPIAAVPEPSTLALLAVGLLGLCRRRHC